MIGAVLLAGCGGGGGETEVSSPSDFEPPAEPVNIGGDVELYDPERLIDVSLTMSSADFSKLKSEARTLASTDRECVPEFEYTQFTASVTIDGIVSARWHVGLRRIRTVLKRSSR